MRVALFITCFNDTFCPTVGQAVIRLLDRLDQSVEFPESQTCCGQLHFNAGYRQAAVPLVGRFLDAFESFDAVVTPSPSCAAMIRHHQATVAALASEGAGHASLPARVAALAPRVYELTEFLIDVLGVTDVGAVFKSTVAYHPTCHSVRALGIGDRPQRLLSKVKGLTLRELDQPDQCCGFGGLFAVKNADTSLAMGADKVAAVVASGADVLTAADTSCLLHLGGMLNRMSSSVRLLHLAEILASDGSGL